MNWPLQDDGKGKRKIGLGDTHALAPSQKSSDRWACHPHHVHQVIKKSAILMDLRLHDNKLQSIRDLNTI